MSRLNDNWTDANCVCPRSRRAQLALLSAFGYGPATRVDTLGGNAAEGRLACLIPAFRFDHAHGGFRRLRQGLPWCRRSSNRKEMP
jgi:hypothetical protein